MQLATVLESGRLRQVDCQSVLASQCVFYCPPTGTLYLADLFSKCSDNPCFQQDSPYFGIPELAERVGLSQMQVYRKLKALTDKTPSQFIRSYRLNKGLKMIQTSDLNISEIAYEVGFSDPNYFSRTFHKEFGNPPGYYRD